MRLAATLILLLSAAWPLDAQTPRASTRGRIYTYFIEQGAPATGYKAGDRELATWALQAWERGSAGAVRFLPVSSTSPRVRITWVSPREGQYGETVWNRGRRSVTVYIRPDTESLGPAIAEAARLDPLLRDAIVYLTCLHELGHAIGLTHTADERDIMYSFQFGGDVRAFFTRYRDLITRRTEISVTTGLSAQDIARARALR